MQYNISLFAATKTTASHQQLAQEPRSLGHSNHHSSKGLDMMLHTETATTARHKMIHYNNSIVLQTVGHGKHSKYVDLKIKMIHYNIFYTDIVKTNSMNQQRLVCALASNPLRHLLCPPCWHRSLLCHLLCRFDVILHSLLCRSA